ncbi:MAG: M20 family metallopeptidase [Acidimicrobiia bacterium]|nr:M20 family metallopeptidase [Acidimicrobiia bacterium]
MDLKQQAEQLFGEVAGELEQISKWLYDHPELAYQEHESSARLVEFLGGNGFEVEHPSFGLETAFSARAGSEGPEVIICAEYDALPEVGHACGHNIIATAACGAGVALAPLAEKLGFRVRVQGTPAEEAYGGKVDLIKAGAFEGGALSIMVHPGTSDVVDKPFLAVAHMDVDFYGTESHAAFAPELGRNALDAAVMAYTNVGLMRQRMIATDKVHGVITAGGEAPNVIPPHTSMAWYARADTHTRLEELMKMMTAQFEAAAIASGCRLEISERGHTYTDMIVDPLLADLYAENSEATGRVMARSGELDILKTGSTDMANVSHELPSLHPMLDIHCDPHVNHQREFAAATVEPAGNQAMRDGALAMAWTVIDIARDKRWDELGARN